MQAKLKIITAMTAFGTISLFVKNIALSSSEIAFWRGVIAMAVLFIFMLATKGFSQWTAVKKQLPKLILSGAAMGFNWILLFEAYNYTSVALSTLCYYFAPTVVILMSAVIFREKLTRKQLICFIASTAGLVLIIGVSGGNGGGHDFIGVLYGLGAALLYAAVVLLNKATGGIPGLTRTFFQFMAAVLVLLPYIAMTNGFHIGALDGKGMVNLLIIGVVHTGIMYFLYFSSLSELRGQQAAILSYIDPLVAIIVSVLLLGETMTVMQLVGGAAILLFTLLNEITLKKSERDVSCT